MRVSLQNFSLFLQIPSLNLNFYVSKTSPRDLDFYIFANSWKNEFLIHFDFSVSLGKYD